MNAISSIIFEIRNATHKARRQTGDKRIGVSTQNGYFRAEIITDMPNGSCIIDPLTEWTTAEKVIKFLNAVTVSQLRAA